MQFDPFNVGRELYGNCSYEDPWKPGIAGWGETDAESYFSSEVSTLDYDRLLLLYCEAKGISLPHDYPVSELEIKQAIAKEEAAIAHWKEQGIYAEVPRRQAEN